MLVSHSPSAVMCKRSHVPTPFPTRTTKAHHARQKDVGEDCQHDRHTGRGEVTNEALRLLGANWEHRKKETGGKKEGDDEG